MFRVGIIGCGEMANAHAEQIANMQGCKIVGVCDKEELRARQLCERFGINDYFDNVKKFLEGTHPQVVHITTPPQSHFGLGKTCLEAGVHVYIEKPFTINSLETRELIDLANMKGLKLTVGHDQQFTHPALRMRKLIGDGYLGGPPIVLESYYGYDFSDPIYARRVLDNKEHWVRKLPGGLLQNVISHGISKIAEFMTNDEPNLIVHGFTSSFLRDIGEVDIIDELRVIICDDNDTTAFFTFSSQMRPILHQFRIYGPKNSLIVDYNQQTVIRVRGDKYRGGLERFVPSLAYAKQYVSNAVYNLRAVTRKDFHVNYGLKVLISLFYRSIVHDTEPPIPYREIVLTSRIMDSIFEQLRREEMM